MADDMKILYKGGSDGAQQRGPKRNRTMLILESVLCVAVLLLIGWKTIHNWTEATCEAPRTCTICGKTEGEPLAHEWVQPEGTSQPSCSRCGAIRYILVGGRYSCPGYPDAKFYHDSGNNSLTAVFPEDSGLAGAQICVEDSYGEELDKDLYRIVWEGSTANTYFLDGLEPGIYTIYYGEEKEIWERSVYGVYGEWYHRWSGTDWGVEEIEPVNLASGRTLQWDGIYLTTVSDSEDAQPITIHSDLKLRSDSNGIWADPDSSGELFWTTEWMYDSEGDWSACHIFRFDGKYVAADLQGNVYLTENLTDECRWIANTWSTLDER